MMVHNIVFLFLLLAHSLLQSPTKVVAASTVKVFKYYSYQNVLATVDDLGKRYPGLVRVFDAEKEFNLPSPHNCGGGLRSVPCRTPMMQITNFATFDDNAKKYRPEVFFSGEIHGNERVGPQTLMELAIFLLETYSQSNPDSPYYNKPNPWVKRLIDERSIFLSPITNSLGYFQNTREEAQVDPNRDYPIDDDPSGCMQTMASRYINELFRNHMFQISLTYHGGMQAIAYEWGTRSHRRNTVSPDDTSQQALGSMMSAFAGPFPRFNYPHGRLSDLVYPVYGGMEDWAYAASWEHISRNKPCTTSKYGGYPQERTIYGDDQLRDINILIETADAKTPSEDSLGTSATLLQPGGIGDGHVPRNVRLALIVTDMVQPYIQWVVPLGSPRKSQYSFNHVQKLQTFEASQVENCMQPEWSKDPLNFLFLGNKSEHSVVELATGSTAFRLAWHVGGSSTVDGTQVIIGRWDSNKHKEEIGFGWSDEQLQAEFGNVSEFASSHIPNGATITALQHGAPRWAGGSRTGDAVHGNVLLGQDLDYGRMKAEMNLEEWPYQPRWQECIQVPNVPGEYFVIARARVDSAWDSVMANKGSDPSIPPQSHLVNARTNPNWDRSNGGHRIKGRLDWYSTPLRVKVVESKNLQGGNITIGHVTSYASNGTDATSAHQQISSSNDNAPLGFMVLGFFSSLLGKYLWEKRRSRNSYRLV